MNPPLVVVTVTVTGATGVSRTEVVRPTMSPYGSCKPVTYGERERERLYFWE